ncbi:MAG TPA: hypothetical protein VHE37_09165, partial [Nevskiaceae bacterium]|nr:hypothetical protein [Nevskiaceae bacterium]
VVLVAASLEVHPGTVSGVIHGNSTSRRIATKIARTVGMPLSRLWPGRYESRSRPSRARRLSESRAAVSG